MQEIKAAVFDMDGLLIDSESIALSLFEQTCEQYQLFDKASLRELFLSCVGTNATETDRRIKAALAEKINVEQFMVDCETRYNGHMTQHAIPVKAGVGKLLDALDRRNIPCVVATSSATHHAMIKLQNCNLAHRFKTVIGGEQVQKSKPEPDIFLAAAKSIAVEPQHCLAFEDSTNGVRAAVAAGMRVFQVPDLIPPDAELLALGHSVVSSLAQVEEIVWRG